MMLNTRLLVKADIEHNNNWKKAVILKGVPSTITFSDLLVNKMLIHHGTQDKVLGLDVRYSGVT